MKIVAIIPAYNESKTIKAVICGAKEFMEVIVVDDGSLDGTCELATLAGALVVKHEDNMGYDASLATGINEALRLGFDYAITLDADGQHDPMLLSEFLKAINSGADLVLGQRNYLQRFSEKIFSLTGQILWGIADPLCGMKGYRLALLAKHGAFSTFSSAGTEFAIRIVKSGARIKEIPVSTLPRIGLPRFGGAFKANTKILYALLLDIVIIR